MASGYPNSKNLHQWEPNEPWNKYPKTSVTPSTTTVTIPSLSSIFGDQFFLGFNDQINRWQTLTTMKKPSTFPPYNIIKVDNDHYTLELAVAGYTKEDIEISVEKDLLTVKSKMTITPIESGEETKVIHQGIAERHWTQQFVLGEWMSVKEATLKDGLLTIKVEREIPEELKPKTIKIK